MHLASLSRLAIDSGAGEGTTTLWTAYRKAQRYAIRILQIFLPILEILLLIALLAEVACAVQPSKGYLWVPLVLGGVGSTVLAFLLIANSKLRISVSAGQWALLSLLPGLAGTLLAGALTSLTHSIAIATAISCWLVVGFALLYWILGYYEDVRRGVRATGWCLYFASLLIFSGFAITRTNQETAVALATYWTGKLLLAGLRLSWTAMIVFAFTACILGSLAWRSQPDAESKARARAAVRTSRLVLALPTLLFLLLTTLLWQGIIEFTPKKTLFESRIVKQGIPGPWPHLKPNSQLELMKLSLFPDPSLGEKNLITQASDLPHFYLVKVLAWSVGYQFPATLLLAALALFLVVWWVLPSVWTERFPLRQEKKAPRRVDDETSIRMGSWLSRGLDATRLVTALVWASVFLAPAIYFLATMPMKQITMGYLEKLQWVTEAIINPRVVAASVILAALAKTGSTALRTMLDVDTYLRTSPMGDTPRARIFERYMSTLRYIEAYRDEDNQGYDSIVIFAHSLGALISSDLLHFLQSSYSEEQPLRLPIVMLTVGNPDRQLLNRFFPYLYDWIQAAPDNGGFPLPVAAEQPPTSIGDKSLPNPDQLGVKLWVNAYRSGDYVGRSLWLNEWYKRPKKYAMPHVVHSPNGSRSELCIGAGAHTHYMDDTAPEIACVLDELI